MSELNYKKICYLMQALSMELQLRVYKRFEIGSKKAKNYDEEEKEIKYKKN